MIEPRGLNDTHESDLDFDDAALVDVRDAESPEIMLGGVDLRPRCVPEFVFEIRQVHVGADTARWGCFLKVFFVVGHDDPYT